MSKKIISFSLWGSEEKYTMGAIRNAELASKIYPGWRCRFYIDTLSVPLDTIKALEQFDVDIYSMPRDMSGWKGMFARFLPASEDDVDVFISRDCDSRLSEREAAAVSEWMNSPRLIHSMRDHLYHTVPILGGMWGAKRDAIPNMKALIEEWNQEDRWQTDQEFLRDVIWPINAHKVLAHDNWNRFPGMAQNRFFPTERTNQDFIGSIMGANDERLHPEHHTILGAR
jgi:hypothetical protein